MAKDKTINCPRCTTLFKVYRLRKIKHPTGATLDICDKCSGMWLDGSEVQILYKKQTASKKLKR